jgi:16S rRNA (cytosine1402-N4)-methyltransferase
VASAAEVGDSRLTIVLSPFSRLGEVLADLGVGPVQGILLDLGMSSPQVDDPERGFSFMKDGPLDMRMGPDARTSAADWLNAAEEREIEEVVREHGEERFAKRIARAIVEARRREPIRRTGRLAEVVARAVPTREAGQHPATRTFQAVRIFINREHQELARILPQCVEALAQGGRLAVISFHSLEDRVVKRFLRDVATPPEIPPGLAVRETDRPKPPMRLVGRAVRPSAAEIVANPRARSAVLRVAERI